MGPDVLDKRVREEGSPSCCAIFSEDLGKDDSLCSVLGRMDLLNTAWEEDCEHIQNALDVQQFFR